MPSPTILILDTQQHTTRNRARRFVRDGRAAWIELNVSIRFVSDHHAHKSAQLSQHELLMRSTGTGYDRVRKVLTRDELHHIPFAGDIDRLMNRGKRRRTGAAQVA